MGPSGANFRYIETNMIAGLGLVGTAIDTLGVLIIVGGIIIAALRFIVDCRSSEAAGALAGCGSFRLGIGQALLLGLEVLVAADIVKTVAVELTAMSLAVLAGLIVVRTFLGWTLVLEVEGRWPWQRTVE